MKAISQTTRRQSKQDELNFSNIDLKNRVDSLNKNPKFDKRALQDKSILNGFESRLQRAQAYL